MVKRAVLAQVAAAVAALGRQVVEVENRYADRQWAERDIARADSIVRFGDPFAAEFFQGIADAEATHVPVEKGGGKWGVKRIASGSVYGTFDSKEEAAEAIKKAREADQSKGDSANCKADASGFELGKLGQAHSDAEGGDGSMGMEDEEETYLNAKNAHTLKPTRESKAALETAAYRLNGAKERAAQEREEALNVTESVGAGAQDSKSKAKKK